MAETGQFPTKSVQSRSDPPAVITDEVKAEKVSKIDQPQAKSSD
jgi:hypothetical protein